MEPIQISDVKSFLNSLDHEVLLFEKNQNDFISIAMTVVALANSSGGVVMIGLDEKGKIVGVNPFDCSNLHDFISSNLSPKIELQTSLYQLKHRFFLKLEVLSSKLVHSFRNINQKWVRSIVIDGKPVVANDVMDELLNLSVDTEYKKMRSRDCCDEICAMLSKHGESSFTKIASEVSYRRKEVTYNLAYLILEEKVNFNLIDLQFTYFIN